MGEVPASSRRTCREEINRRDMRWRVAVYCLGETKGENREDDGSRFAGSGGWGAA